ncbi:hypothetical protein QEW_0645 [Clostridioides difficile CD160]|nr:hypothetical protein QEW_0645 [Clostridioides difficile CD160]
MEELDNYEVLFFKAISETIHYCCKLVKRFQESKFVSKEYC